jgi:hypothetical protein
MMFLMYATGVAQPETFAFENCSCARARLGSFSASADGLSGGCKLPDKTVRIRPTSQYRRCPWGAVGVMERSGWQTVGLHLRFLIVAIQGFQCGRIGAKCFPWRTAVRGSQCFREYAGVAALAKGNQSFESCRSRWRSDTAGPVIPGSRAKSQVHQAWNPLRIRTVFLHINCLLA